MEEEGKGQHSEKEGFFQQIAQGIRKHNLTTFILLVILPMRPFYLFIYFLSAFSNSLYIGMS